MPVRLSGTAYVGLVSVRHARNYQEYLYNYTFIYDLLSYICIILFLCIYYLFIIFMYHFIFLFYNIISIYLFIYLFIIIFVPIDLVAFFFLISLFYPGPDSSLFACSPIGPSLGMSTFISLQALRITYD